MGFYNGGKRCDDEVGVEFEDGILDAVMQCGVSS
jgi:hypothetical protein